MFPTTTGQQTIDCVDLSIQQFLGAWRVMCAGAPGLTAETIDGMHCVFSCCPIPFFNVALPADRRLSPDGLKSYGDRACEWAARRGVPWLFVVTHEALEPGTDAAAVLDGSGLTPLMPLTGMLAERLSTASTGTSVELTVPQDDAACAAILDVNGAAYGMDLEAAKELLGRRHFWNDHFAVLGLSEGGPASTAAVLMVDGYRYVALVATRPDQQRRGFGEAAMRHALELAGAAHGERTTVLHATDAGRPIYARMGYATISTHTLYIEKRFLDHH